MKIQDTNNNYMILSPWADADPVPLKGITPRVTELEGKKIGLFLNISPGSRPILTAVENELKDNFPTCTISWYDSQLSPGESIMDLVDQNKTEFEEWLSGVDMVIAAVGD